MISYVVELLDDWNVDVPSRKYSRNLQSPRVSSPGFDNDSNMMVMRVDITAQVAPELPLRQFQGRPFYRRLGLIGLYARRPVRCVPHTATPVPLHIPQLNVKKRDLSPTALHAIALETINTRFPPEEWLHIYTDGSLLDFAQGGGIGVFSHLFSFYLHAGPLTTYFDGEVEAIHIALQQLAVRLPPIERAVILSDSTSALQALSNYNENNCLRVQNCRELLGKIKGKIVFQWVPSHCVLWGNERADFLAKKGTGILQNFRRDLTLHSAKLEIKRIFRESFRLTASRVARDKPM
ncbi:uncharacterized protein LOC103521360 [Trichonephila clavipes]|nr:uncharacterized protein LOC103521360 [Trichonephila clavipes]